jgi:hypothetical protein
MIIFCVIKPRSKQNKENDPAIDEVLTLGDMEWTVLSGPCHNFQLSLL